MPEDNKLTERDIDVLCLVIKRLLQEIYELSKNNK